MIVGFFIIHLTSPHPIILVDCLYGPRPNDGRHPQDYDAEVIAAMDVATTIMVADGTMTGEEIMTEETVTTGVMVERGV